MLNRTREVIENSPVMMKNGYPYVITPISDGVGRVSKDVMCEIIGRMKDIGDFDADIIVTIESMGIPFAVPLSLDTGIPFNIIRKRSYGIEGEVAVDKYTGYEKSTVYINGLKKGDRVLIVDDMISTGGSIRAVVDSIRKIGCTVVQVLVVIDKGNNAGKIAEELNVPIRAVFGLDVVEGRPVFREIE